MLFFLLVLSFSNSAKTIFEEAFDEKGNLVCQHINDETNDIEYELPGKCGGHFFNLHVQCSNIYGDIVHLYKGTFRIDNYSVFAFGQEFFAAEDSVYGIKDQVEVNAVNPKTVGSYLPFKLKFFSEKNDLGYSDTPHKVEIFYKFGRATTVQNLICEVVN